jgi:hypothetical protein
MGRRKHTVAAFSLFSFQDIITSVTAILILLVLILTLELISSKHKAAASDPAASARDLRAAAVELESLAESLSKVVPLQSGIGVERKRDDVLRELEIMRDQTRRAVAAAETASAVEMRSADLLAKARARLKERMAGMVDIDALVQQSAEAEAEASMLALENEQERDRLARKEEKRKSRPADGTELVFNAPPGEKKQPWLVEVSVEGFVAVRLGGNAPEHLGAQAEPGSAAATWVSALGADRDYVLILIRPSGVDSYDALRTLLGDAGIAFGVDFIGEDQAVRDGTGETQREGRDFKS